MKAVLSKIQTYSIPLIVGVIAAVVWANLSFEGYESFVNFSLFNIFGENVTVHFIVQDIFMMFFFGTAAVEIVESLQPGGPLNPIKTALNPLIATAGGLIGPIIVFTILNMAIGSPEYSNGWGIPTATDIAIAWLFARLIFGPGHTAVKFLLLLAIVDDAVGLVIIAIFYPDPTAPVEPLWLLLCVAGILIAMLLSKKKVLSYWPYLLICGVLSWLGMHNAHIHPSLALVVIIPFMPRRPRITNEDKTFGVHIENVQYPIERFAHDFKGIVDYGLFFFGLANAGVPFSTISPITAIVTGSLIIGKTLGVFFMGTFATKIGFPLPKGMDKRDLLTAGAVAGIGLTVALFMCGSAFTDVAIQGAAKMGALFSCASALLAFALARLLKIKRVEYEIGIHF